MTVVPFRNELRPCPFCGAAGGDLIAEGYPLAGWRVRCGRCNARVPGEAWNDRAEFDAIGAERWAIGQSRDGRIDRLESLLREARNVLRIWDRAVEDGARGALTVAQRAGRITLERLDRMP